MTVWGSTAAVLHDSTQINQPNLQQRQAGLFLLSHCMDGGDTAAATAEWAHMAEGARRKIRTNSSIAATRLNLASGIERAATPKATNTSNEHVCSKRASVRSKAGLVCNPTNMRSRGGKSPCELSRLESGRDCRNHHGRSSPLSQANVIISARSAYCLSPLFGLFGTLFTGASYEGKSGKSLYSTIRVCMRSVRVLKVWFYLGRFFCTTNNFQIH